MASQKSTSVRDAKVSEQPLRKPGTQERTGQLVRTASSDLLASCLPQRPRRRDPDFSPIRLPALCTRCRSNLWRSRVVGSGPRSGNRRHRGRRRHATGEKPGIARLTDAGAALLGHHAGFAVWQASFERPGDAQTTQPGAATLPAARRVFVAALLGGRAGFAQLLALATRAAQHTLGGFAAGAGAALGRRPAALADRGAPASRLAPAPRALGQDAHPRAAVGTDGAGFIAHVTRR